MNSTGNMTMAAGCVISSPGDKLHNTIDDYKSFYCLDQAENVSRPYSSETYTSEKLKQMQSKLASHSTEVTLMHKIIQGAASIAAGRHVKEDELRYAANFGAPVIDGAHRISIRVYDPVEFNFFAIRSLIADKLHWTIKYKDLTVPAAATLSGGLRGEVDVKLTLLD